MYKENLREPIDPNTKYCRYRTPINKPIYSEMQLSKMK